MPVIKPDYDFGEAAGNTMNEYEMERDVNPDTVSLDTRLTVS